MQSYVLFIGFVYKANQNNFSVLDVSVLDARVVKWQAKSLNCHVTKKICYAYNVTIVLTRHLNYHKFYINLSTFNVQRLFKNVYNYAFQYFGYCSF